MKSLILGLFASLVATVALAQPYSIFSPGPSGPVKSNGSYALQQEFASDITGLFSGCSAGAPFLSYTGVCAAAAPTTPAGSTSQVQYNSGGAFAASADFTYNGTTTITLGSTTQGILTGTAPAATSSGGTLRVTAPSGGATSGNGGTLALSGGLVVEGNGGALALSAGNANSASSTNRSGGSVTIFAGNGAFGGTGGNITLNSGGSSTGTFGSLFLESNGIIGLTLGPDAGITAGSPTGGDKGLGSINMVACFVNNVACATGSLPVSANPSGTIGLTAVNGTASTFMTSDSAPALSQAIVPTWTGVHTFTNTTSFQKEASIALGNVTGTALGVSGGSASFNVNFVASSSTATVNNTGGGPINFIAGALQFGGANVATTQVGTGTLTYASGCSSGSFAPTYHYVISGSIATVTFNTATCTSTSGNMVVTGWPTALQPVTSASTPTIMLFDNSVNTMGFLTINTGSGTVNFTPISGAFSGTSGVSLGATATFAVN